MIVITTPTGQIGSQLARTLVDAGEPVRVIARDPNRLARELRDGAEVVQGSHGNAAVLDEALEGADALFWVVPPDPRAEDIKAAYVGFTRPAARYQQVPFDAFGAQMRERGISDAFVQGFVAMMRAKNDGMDNAASRTAEAATPTTFHQWCSEVLKRALAG